MFVFLIDTSVSMNRPFSRSFTYLEAAKAAVEHFVKFESKRGVGGNGMPVKYILATYDSRGPIMCDGTSKEFLESLTTLQALDLSDAGASFGALFDYLGIMKISDYNDIPGKGRYPAIQDTTLIFWLTDAGYFSSQNSVVEMINIPGGKLPGAEGYYEPFRWEHRLYTLVLKGEGGGGVHPRNPSIGALTEAMGGQIWECGCIRTLLQTIDNCFETKHQKVQPLQSFCHINGVAMKLASHPGNADKEYKPEGGIFIYANLTVSRFFPIPEGFWPDNYKRPNEPLGKFPPRHAHPVIHVSTKNDSCHIYEGFPCDRLSMEQGFFAHQLTQRGKNCCWTAFVEGSSSTPGMGHPFGFFKVTKAGNAVNFYILPYNFKKLFSLLQSGSGYKKGKVSPSWSISFMGYLKETPCYYWPLVKNGMEVVGLSHLWPVQTEVHFLELELSSYCERLRVGARQALERLRALMRDFPKQQLLKEHSNKKRKIDGRRVVLIENPYDIKREDLKSQLALRISTLSNTGTNKRNPNLLTRETQEEKDLMHMIPISEMGNYTQAMIRSTPLRDAREDEEDRVDREKFLFGNPYKRLPKISRDRATSNLRAPASPTPSQDSVMLNEADEEASHDFDHSSETSSTLGSSSNSNHHRIKNFHGQSRIPSLYIKPKLSFPASYRDLTWKNLSEDTFQYTYREVNTNYRKDWSSASLDLIMEGEERTFNS